MFNNTEAGGSATSAHPAPDRVRDLIGQVALVTGGSRGIGRAIVLDLIRAGANVLVWYRANDQAALETRAAADALGGTAVIHRVDVRDKAQIAETIDGIGRDYQRIDILVNCAGIVRDRTIGHLSDEDWDEVIATNLTGAFHACRAVVPLMKRRSYGRIVNVSSIVASTGGFGQANYAASKSGLLGFTRSLALELATKGITANAVCPGFINTEMLTSVPDPVQKAIVSRIPLGRFGRPDEVADVVGWLVSPRTAYVTGQAIHINGGLYL